MNNLSLVILDGNLVQDPELKELSNDRKVVNFTVAANHGFRSKEDNSKEFVSYFNIEAWDRQADAIAQYLKKGSRVTVEGNLRQDRWKDDEGFSRNKIKIVARNVRFDWVQKKEASNRAA
ncbi:MAG TPA: single-stranded DNA-binding protein [Leptospiraceae bacterium]|nr:single-stranded DNA-binding protein [Spirochaetaceae bacterium]HBS05315.1 single-stranded DNA-binding protein [Leptospiraceae bacterium]|tara:strand:+ start:2807 stop:3166 length:360 start_codon:yes stop_codon:yes gene_type:complete